MGKLVLFVVEGPSDATALADPLQAELKRRVEPAALHCDVMTVPRHRAAFRRRTGITPVDDVRENLRALVNAHIRLEGYGPERLGHVIQLTDLDGVFTPDGMLAEDPSLTRYSYGLDSITVPDLPRATADRMLRRRSIQRLVDAKPELVLDGWHVPYRLYYASRNLEHAFAADWRQYDDDGKKDTAYRVRRRFLNDPGLLPRVLEGLRRIHGNPANWESSWEYAMEGMHSLERGSNLSFVFPFIESTASYRARRR